MKVKHVSYSQSLKRLVWCESEVKYNDRGRFVAIQTVAHPEVKPHEWLAEPVGTPLEVPNVIS